MVVYGAQPPLKKRYQKSVLGPDGPLGHRVPVHRALRHLDGLETHGLPVRAPEHLQVHVEPGQQLSKGPLSFPRGGGKVQPSHEFPIPMAQANE